MQGSVTVDQLDRRIIAALQINARASYPAIAAALGEQERTVFRRAERLLESGSVRLTAFVDELRTGPGQTVTLRISVEPGALDAVADRLCAREDARAVMAVTGAADLSCELVAADTASLHRVIAAELPRIAGIRRTRSYPVLRHVKPTSTWRLPVLTRAEAAALHGVRPAADDRRVELGPADRELLAMLRADARLSYVALADRLGVTPTTARRHLDRLLGSGAVALRAWVEPERLGLAVEADVWLRVRPDALEHTVTRLARRAEVTYCGVIAGPYAVELLVAVPDLSQLYAFSAAAIGPAGDIVDSEPTLITHTYKRGGLRVDDPALAPA